MRRLVVFFRPYWGLLLLAAGMVLLQAYANMALPDYMARIVNVGIQQAGVERPLPQALRETTVRRVALFLSPEEKARLEAAYRRLTPGSS